MTKDAPTTEAAVHLDRIGQIAITVSDLARSKDFYLNTLGMKFLFDAGNMAFFQCGEIRLMIGTSDQPSPRGGTILYFKVPDIQAVHARLVEHGVTLSARLIRSPRCPITICGSHFCWTRTAP
jgi:predicted enzyme related to lactoylglutathione lyase